MAAECGWLPKIGPAKLVFSKRPRDPWKNLLAVATSDLQVTPRRAIILYERRWAIEVLFKELRSLGLGAYQMLHRKGRRAPLASGLPGPSRADPPRPGGAGRHSQEA